MVLSERAQEILETFWLQKEGEAPPPLTALEHSEAFDELMQVGLLTVVDEKPILTERGWRESQAAIRRHRLAERLMADVLDVRSPNLDEASCKFEHMLFDGIEDKVCRLLGHPGLCPHGKPIPEGSCCSKKTKSAEKLVATMADLEVGEEGQVAYLSTEDDARMDELMAIGVVPGVSVKLLRKYPAFLFALDQSEFAVDQEMATAIHVRLHK